MLLDLFLGDLFSDEEACRSNILCAPGIGMAVEGGSEVLQPNDINRLTATLRRWCPGKPAKMELLYRASRDGWTSEPSPLVAAMIALR